MNRKLLSLFLLGTLALSMNAQVVAVDSTATQRASDPNQVIGEAMKTTGTVSLAVGVPCLAAGLASLMYANFLPNPVANCTTSSQLATDKGLELISVEEYNNQVRDFSKKTHAAEVAGYILTPLGGALTIVGIPLYVKGNKMLQLDVQYTGNGAGVAVNF
ncbi:MAG: hypothetical protein MJZ75_05845 [Paludibacteraceae bacterium]|nr:hypothetical protein [Paludibacteraceae bacterium]